MNNKSKKYYLRISEKSDISIIELAITKGISNFILDENVLINEVDAASFYYLSSDNECMNAKLASTIADCMNAEKDNVDLILWDSKDFSDLESLIPIKAPYGWMILSLNTPVILNLEDVSDSEINNIDSAGHYSYELEDLLNIQSTNEQLKSE
jgi:hypothetical protein